MGVCLNQLPPGEPLARAHFRNDTVAVAQSLLGKILCRRIAPREIVRTRITETEAYDGFDDRASHASRGLTERTALMYGPAGYWYVYLCYGVHWMLNVVTREEGYPAAILIRGCDVAIGPGRLTRQLAVDKSLNGSAAVKGSGLWIEDDGVLAAPAHVTAAPRVGVDYAGAVWAAKPWRFCWDGSC